MTAEIASSSFCASAFDTAPLAADRSLDDMVAVGSVEALVEPLVPVGLVGSVALDVGGGVAAGGFAALVVGGLLAGGVSLAGSVEVVVAPPAAFENSVRCVRNSVSFARIAGSSCALPVAGVEPLVPTAPVVPLPLVPAVVGVGFVPAAFAGSAPMSAVRLASTFAYEARQLVCVVISSLKFEISCETCVRASPCSFEASGIVVN
jgi:hypothetical protein